MTDLAPFAVRVKALPELGLGVSTEYGAAGHPGALDLVGLRRHFPSYAQFLEVGVEVAVGIDAHARDWVAAGGRTTYHFLDVNLDEPEDFDAEWLDSVRTTAAALQPAWLCGDAGVWHFGCRDRGQMLLLPPVLTRSVAEANADGVRALRAATGLEVLPENPPGAAFVGDLHLLSFYSALAEAGDTGLVLDAAHLAIYQAARGLEPLAGFADFAIERVVELHVAGGKPREVAGFRFIEDDHSPAVLDTTWRIVEAVVARAPNLKAIVFECERNPVQAMLPAMGRLERLWAGRRSRVGAPLGTGVAPRGAALDHAAARALQHELVLRHFAPRGAAPRPPIDGIDPRAFLLDPLRPKRLCGALIEEYPVASAILGVDAVEEFLGSAAWEACVRGRGSMALTFGAWVEGRVGAVARLEAAIVRVRRARAEPMGDGRLRLASGAELLRLPEGVYAAWGHAHAAGELALRVAAGLRLAAPVPAEHEEWVVVVPEGAGVRVEALPDAAGTLLAATRAGLTRAEVEAEVVRLGAGVDDAVEIVYELVADGLLA